MNIKLNSGSRLIVTDSNDNIIVNIKEDGTVTGAGTKLYRHVLHDSNNNYINFISCNSTPITNTASDTTSSFYQKLIEYAVSAIYQSESPSAASLQYDDGYEELVLIIYDGHELTVHSAVFDRTLLVSDTVTAL